MTVVAYGFTGKLPEGNGHPESPDFSNGIFIMALKLKKKAIGSFLCDLGLVVSACTCLLNLGTAFPTYSVDTQRFETLTVLMNFRLHYTHAHLHTHN